MDRYPPYMQVNMYLDCLPLDIERYALTSVDELKEPIYCNGDKISELFGRFIIDDEFSPKGSSIFEMYAICSSTKQWKSIKNNPIPSNIEQRKKISQMNSSQLLNQFILA